MYRMRSIGVKISVYIGLLILAVCVSLGLFAYSNGSSAVIAEVEQALVMQANEASRYVERGFQVQLSILEAIAARPEIQSMDWEMQQAVLRSESERLPQFLALGVADRTGMARYSDGSTVNIGDRNYFVGAMAGKSVVSDIIVSRVSNSLVLMYSVPIKSNGQVVGALIGRRDGAELSDVTDRLGFGSGGWAYIFHSDGTIYAHPERGDVMEQRNLFTDTGELADVGRAVKELGVGKSGVIRFSIENSRRISGLAPVPSTGWVIGIGVIENDVLRNVNRFRNFLVWISITFVGLGVAVAILISKQVANPLQKVQGVIEAVAEGDLTKNVQVRVRDEVGRVADALNTTIAKMREAMGAVADVTQELAGTSEEMAAASQEVSASIEEVASTTNQFSSALEMMNQNAQDMSQNVQDISNKASQGESAIEDIIGQISALHENIQNLAHSISELGTLSDKIGSIVNVIGNIADQTNLLALNAAIEAARAGEHGRGFAVVAEEVRNLAEQSATATMEITALISQIQGGVSTAVTDMNQGADQASLAVSSVDESGQILRSILEDVERIVGEVQEISAGLEQTNGGGHEIASATEEQAASIQQVASSAQDLTNMGLKLQELVRHFKLSNLNSW